MKITEERKFLIFYSIYPWDQVLSNYENWGEKDFVHDDINVF